MSRPNRCQRVCLPLSTRTCAPRPLATTASMERIYADRCLTRPLGAMTRPEAAWSAVARDGWRVVERRERGEDGQEGGGYAALFTVFTSDEASPRHAIPPSPAIRASATGAFRGPIATSHA